MGTIRNSFAEDFLIYDSYSKEFITKEKSPTKRYGMFLPVRSPYCHLFWLQSSYISAENLSIWGLPTVITLSDKKLIEKFRPLSEQKMEWGITVGGWLINTESWEKYKLINFGHASSLEIKKEHTEIKRQIEKDIKKEPDSRFIWLYEIEEMLTHPLPEVRRLGKRRLKNEKS